MRNRYLIALVCALLLGLGSAVQAQSTITWTGLSSPADTLWSNAANWDLGVIPGAADTVYIPSASGPIALGGPQTVTNLGFLGGGVTVGAAGATDVLSISDGGAIVKAAGPTSNEIVAAPLTLLGDTVFANYNGWVHYANMLEITGPVTGAAGKTITIKGSGDGSVRFTADNSTTLASSIVVESGMLLVSNSNGLGTGLVTLAEGAHIWMDGGAYMTNNVDVVGNAVQSNIGPSGFAGKVTIADAMTFSIGNGGGNPNTFSGEIAGSGTLAMPVGNNTFSGAVSNTLSGKMTMAGNSGYGPFNEYRLAKTGGAIAVAGPLEVSNLAHVQWTHSDQIADSSAITLSGKVIEELPSTATALIAATSALMPQGQSDKMGTLTLATGTTVIDFTGAGTVADPVNAGLFLNSVLKFDDSSAMNWTGKMVLANWTGLAAGGGTSQLIFGNSATALTSSQLSMIKFLDPAGMAGVYAADILATGEIVPKSGAIITSAEWVNPGSGNWNVTVNWTPGTPNGVGQTANFLGAITSDATVTVDAATTISKVVFNNATYKYTVAGAALTLDGNGSTNVTIDTVAGTHEISAPLASAGTIGVNKAGVGTLILSGANTYTGNTTVAAGTLKFAAANALPNNVGATLTVAAGGTAEFAGTINASNVALTSNTATSNLILDAGASFTPGVATIGGTMATGAGSTLTLGSGNVAATVNTTATGTGTIALVGNAATKTLTSLGAAFDGNIEITASPTLNTNAGAADVLVTAYGLNALGSTVGTTTITNSAGNGALMIGGLGRVARAENLIINANSGIVMFGNENTFSQTVSGNIQINSGTLRLNNGGYKTTYSGIISGPGRIDTLNNSEIFTGANTFSGGFSVGTGKDWFGTYGVTSGITVGGSDTVVSGVIQSGPLGTGTLTFDVATGSWTGTGRIADNGQALTTLHNNVIQRNATSFYSQPALTVVANANTMIFTDAGLTVPSTWTLQPNPDVYSNTAPTQSPINPGTQGSTIPLIMGMTVNTNYTAQIDQVIRQDMGATPGNMTLRKVGAGTLILGRHNTYGGDTLAMQGTLKLGINDALPTTTKLAVGGGFYYVADWPELGLVPPVANPTYVNLTGNTTYGTFDLNGFNQTVAGIGQAANSAVPASNIVTNSNATTASTLTINNAVSNTFGGTFSGNLNLVKKGVGALTLTAQPTLKTTVENGALILTGNVTTPTLAINGGGVILKTADLATTVAQIKTAYGTGTWASTGLTSTTGAAGTGLGVDTAANLGLTTFQGQTVDPTDVLVKYTWLGDADFNGVVNFSDFLKLQAGYGKANQTWTNGDFNYDGSVNFSDFLLLQAAYGKPAVSETVAPVSVPEPATLSLLALGGLALLRRRSQKA